MRAYSAGKSSSQSGVLHGPPCEQIAGCGTASDRIARANDESCQTLANGAFPI